VTGRSGIRLDGSLKVYEVGINSSNSCLELLPLLLIRL